jgi:hypothetical protein
VAVSLVSERLSRLSVTLTRRVRMLTFPALHHRQRDWHSRCVEQPHLTRDNTHRVAQAGIDYSIRIND